jgi:phenylalanyl-tRNA synthetase beta chain
VALEGASLAGDVHIKPTIIRGVESFGMICSERELGISNDQSGIMVLNGVTSVGQPVAEALGFDDHILTFELTPNRPDLMSAIGLARELAALAGLRIKRPQIDLNELSDKAAGFVDVRIEDIDACPRYAARVIRGVKIEESPWWLKSRLLKSGTRPINNVVDITNYVMLECGHPLHAFDLKRFGSHEVVVRRARQDEVFTTLDNQQHKLTPDVLLITNGKVPVAAGGVMGGLDSEVIDTTTDILLEAAYFHPTVIRKSRRVLELVTESSARFEKGADPNGVEFALDRASSLLRKLCDGKVLSGIVDCYPIPLKPKSIKLRPSRCRQKTSTTVSNDRIKDILDLLELHTSGSEPLDVTIPTFRPDIEREIDLIEEVTRIEGFGKVPESRISKALLFAPQNKRITFQQELRRIMTACGFDETLSHGLANSALTTKLLPETRAVRLLNTVSRELDIMRNSLIPGLLTIIESNIAHRNLDLRLFEIGKIYLPPDTPQEWSEIEYLTIAVTGETPSDWRTKPRLHDFYDISGALNQVAARFRLGEVTFSPTENEIFESGLAYLVKIGNLPVGVAGKVSVQKLQILDIKQPVFLADIDLESARNIVGRPLIFTQLPQFPAVLRDLAIVVDESVGAGELVKSIGHEAKGLAESIRIFDVYCGKQIEHGKRSIAIAVSYRSLERSLTSEEVDEIEDRIKVALKRTFNADIRDK